MAGQCRPFKKGNIMVINRSVLGEHTISDSEQRQADKWMEHFDGSELMDWQRYVLSCFPKEEFYELPEDIYRLSAMHKYSTYNKFVWDTVVRNGCIASATLSLAFKPKVVVEFGVHGGFTTLLLCKINKNARIHAVDNSSILADYANVMYPRLPTCYVPLMHNVKNLSLHIMDSYMFDMFGKVDLCFVDGDHFNSGVEWDTWRAWANRNKEGDWCIAWDDYHPNNPDVYNIVNDFVKEVGYPLQKIVSWVWIGNKEISENDLINLKGI
jgi:hypothetical protein